MLSGSPKIVVNLNGVHYIDSGGLGTSLDSLSPRKTEVVNSIWSLQASASMTCFDVQS